MEKIVHLFSFRFVYKNYLKNEKKREGFILS